MICKVSEFILRVHFKIIKKDKKFHRPKYKN